MFLLGLVSRRFSFSAHPTATQPENATWRSDPVQEERTRLMDEIIGTNPSATIEFLSDFPTDALEEYLAHLNNTRIPRGRAARWVRPSVQPGIQCFEPAY